MKYLVMVVFIFLLVPSSTHAALAVPGTVPEVRPLQPPPENSFPNFSGNIQHTSNPDPELEEAAASSARSDTSSDASITGGDSTAQPQGRFSKPWIWLGLVLAAGFFVGTYLVLRKRNK